MICSKLPRGAPPKGLDAGSARFSFSDDDTKITGGKRLDKQKVFTNLQYGNGDREWGVLDEEEVEATNQISSTQ